jgi:diguanylate cyclase (GGDEF)-like protein
MSRLAVLDGRLRLERDRILSVSCVVLLVGVAVFGVSVVPGVRARPGFNGPLDEWLESGVFVFAAVLVGLRAMLYRRDRLAWTVLAIGAGCFCAGNLYYDVALRSMAVVPIPSLQDGLDLMFYPCAYVFVVLQLRRQISRLPLSVWLDGSVPALGVAALSAAYLFGLVVTDTSGSTATVVTNLAYPIGDLVLLTVIVAAFGLFAWHPPRMWWIIGVGMGALALADFAYLFEASRNTYQPGTWVDLLWIIGLGSLALAAREPAPELVMVKKVSGAAALVVPSLFAFTSLGLLVVAARSKMPLAAVSLAAATIVVAVLRTWLTFRELSQLSATRLLARTDDLTGLPNRRHFHQAVDNGTKDHGGRQAVMILDLDRFKEINDSLGHHVGDQLLTELGSRLTMTLGEGNLLARLGGDEFGILVPGADARQAAEVAGVLLRALRGRFELAGVSLHVDASIGVALFPDHANNVGGLLQHADIAMYRAKNAHTGYELSSEVDGGDYQRLETLGALHQALERDELVLHYQPKFNLPSLSVTGVEALVRWQHPTRGLLYPDTFLPLAEQAGLMRRLTLSVLEMAIRQANRWRSEGRPMTVAVNLSASNLLDAHLPGQIDLLLTTLEMPSDLLELEITETVLMADPVRTHQVLSALRALGIRLAVDDYGTGYSSLAYLQDLPVDDLKLDRSFVMRSTTDPRSAAIVASTVGLAHSLRMKIIAEGVETAEALDLLIEAGCDVAQGYHLARPQPAEQLAAWLDRHWAAVTAPTRTP